MFSIHRHIQRSRVISSSFQRNLPINRCLAVVVKSHLPEPEIHSSDIHVPLGKFAFRNFLRNRSEWENNVAIVDGSNGESLTFGEVYRLTYRVASAIRRRLGTKPHGGVAIVSPNHKHWMPAINGISLTNAYTISVNPLLGIDEMDYQLTLADAQIILCHPNMLAKLKPLADKLKIPLYSFQDSAVEGVPTFADFLSQEVFENINVDEFPSNPKGFDTHDTVCVPFSSGTTGKSKGVMLTHKNYISNILQLIPYEGKYLQAENNNGKQQSVLIPLPFFHIYGMVLGMFVPLYTGAKLVFLPQFDLESYLRNIEEHKVSRTHIVPPIAIALAKNPLVDQYDVSTLKSIVCAAAPLGPDVQELLSQRLKCIVKQGWGMTELSPMGTIFADHHKDVQGKVGLLLPETEGKIVCRETGVDLLHHQEGEILIRGPQVMKGYLKNEEATKNTIRSDGWLHTGDIGFFDKEGAMYITDRAKELIKFKGFQVPPAELEALIISLPQVKDVIVIPVPDEEAGEIPRAYVVKQDNCPPEFCEKDIIDFIHSKVAPHKRLRGGVVFTDSIPKSPSGKLLRRVQVQLDRARKANK